MNATRGQGVVVAIGVTGGLPRILDLALFLQRPAAFWKILALLKEVDRGEGHACLDQTPCLGLGNPSLPLAGDPDGHRAVPLLGQDEQDGIGGTAGSMLEDASDDQRPFVLLHGFFKLEFAGIFGHPSMQYDFQRVMDQLTVVSEILLAAERQLLKLLVDVGPPLLEQPAFECGASFRPGMFVVPHRQLVRRQMPVVLLDDRILPSQTQVPIEPRVHPSSTHVVVIVTEMCQCREHHVVGGSEHLVELLEFRKPFGFHFDGPILGRRESQRFGSEEPRDLDIPRPDPKERRVFACASSLHRGGDHHAGHGDGHARIDGGEDERLGSATAGSRHGDPLGIDFGETQEEINRPDRVPRLQAHDRLQVRFGLRTEQAPRFGRYGVGTLLGEPVRQVERELRAVGIADHVVVEDDAAHASQLDAPRLKGTAPSFLEPLFSIDDLAADSIDARIHEPSFGPMPMRAEDAGDFALEFFGTVEIARHKEAGHALEIDLLDRVVPHIAFPVDDGVQRGLAGRRPESQGHLDAPTNLCRSLLPCVDIRRYLEWEVSVEVLERLEPGIGKSLAFGNDVDLSGRGDRQHRDHQDSHRPRRASSQDVGFPITSINAHGAFLRATRVSDTKTIRDPPSFRPSSLTSRQSPV